MKTNLKPLLAVMGAALIICANMEVLATTVPQKSDGSASTQKQYDEETQMIINTISGNKSTDKTSSDDEKATAKPTQEPTASPKSTAKATAKATEKATATPKATAKATAKATEKTTSTSKATATEKTSSSKSTVATVKPSSSDDNDDDNSVTSTIGSDSESEGNVIVVSPSPDPAINVVTNQEQVNAKRYLTKGGAFGMFLLTVLVSAIVSFFISYRFYNMNRTDSHVMAEIRALKRDIDTKMTGTVGGFSEYETKTNNTNPSYSRGNQPIRRRNEEQNRDASHDMYSKWESQINHTQKDTAETPASAPRRRDYTEERTSSTRRPVSHSRKTSPSVFKDVLDIFTKKK